MNLIISIEINDDPDVENSNNWDDILLKNTLIPLVQRFCKKIESILKLK